jgi:hypothetical protein
MAVRGLSIVNGYCSFKVKTEEQGLFFSAVCINYRADLQRGESNRENDVE